jgi:hypothetical protein
VANPQILQSKKMQDLQGLALLSWGNGGVVLQLHHGVTEQYLLPSLDYSFHYDSQTAILPYSIRSLLAC